MAGGIGRKRSEMGGSGEGAAFNIRSVKSLFSGFNSTKNKSDTEHPEGVIGDLETTLTLEIDDSELVKLSNTWKKDFDLYNGDIKPRQEKNYQYWKGEHFANKQSADCRGVDNIIFEATETLLPIAARQSPEPTVEGECTEEGKFVAEMTTNILVDKADETKLKSKIKTACRHWMLGFLGCFKMGWKEEVDDMYFQVIEPQCLILDPKGTFDGAEFTGGFIGEYKKATAQELSDTFPRYAKEISASVEGNMGTSIGYYEWWTNEYVFWRYRDVILDKRSNPYWNEDSTKPGMDNTGTAFEEPVAGVNHFASPKMPYSFLTVFNTGKQPHDETSLIEQVIPLQDIVNKRLRQIDKNADDTNNGWVFNNQFTQDQAKSALNAMRNGGAIIAATESLGESVMRFPAPALANFVYQDLLDKREQIYNIMGVRGSMPQGLISEKTVRGKIEIKGQDVDRLALVIEQIEQFVDHLFNLCVQTIYVYYDEEQATRYLGAEHAAKYIQLLKSGPSRRLLVSVKEGSTIPKDSLTVRNEAMDMWAQGAIDPLTLYEKLQFTDPTDTAKKLLTYQLNPQQTLMELGGMPPEPEPMPGEPMPEPMPGELIDPNIAPMEALLDPMAAMQIPPVNPM